MSGNTECSGYCRAWLRASCLECGSPRCSFSFCSDFLKLFTTCQVIPSSHSQEQDRHRGPEQPSINIHQVGEIFIESVTEVAYDPVVAEASDQIRVEDPIHLTQDMRFKAVIRGWSHQAQQLRTTALLNLNDISLVREMQENHDLILLPVEWWSSAVDTIDPDESGWWYRVSEPTRFRDCTSCGKRIGKDMSVESRGCLKCPIDRLKPVTSTLSKQKEEMLPTKDVTSERRRSLRISNRHLTAGVYCELNEDVDMDSDDNLEQDFQQGYLCVSADPRRVGGPGGEPTIINLKELRTLLCTHQTREDQTVWRTTVQAGFPVVTDTQEIQTDRDRSLGNPMVLFLHPAISSFIQAR